MGVKLFYFLIKKFFFGHLSPEVVSLSLCGYDVSCAFCIGSVYSELFILSRRYVPKTVFPTIAARGRD